MFFWRFFIHLEILELFLLWKIIFPSKRTIWWNRKSSTFVFRKRGFQIWLCLIPAVWLWTTHVPFLHQIFSIIKWMGCKMIKCYDSCTCQKHWELRERKWGCWSLEYCGMSVGFQKSGKGWDQVLWEWNTEPTRYGREWIMPLLRLGDMDLLWSQREPLLLLFFF